ncbi:MAG: hypothetical protein HQK55_18995, partial [Deltaproteobacteria bacterium]|nr:hypothetical protein [Deltaproteobacteria bacterium]
ILEEKLGKYYDRRLAFDNAFEDGTRFRYGALNAGGVGLSLFGDFCMVLNRSFMESLNDAVYLPDDSLVCCFNELHQFDVDAVRRKVCPHTHRHYLDELFNLAFERRGRQLSEADSALMLHFVQILKATRKRSIPLEVLP